MVDTKLEQQVDKLSLDSSHDPIFNLFKENKIDEAIEYINQGKLTEIDCVDEHGTTPLQYACFRGWYDMSVLLISKGADVNAKTHYQGYTALMFAAIGNHKQVVSLLLDHEADVDYKNKIGRTASQMASFVNSHECVDLINGYVSKSALAYFTEIHSISETEPKLPKGECLDQLHRLLIDSSNYSPIRIIKLIKNASNNVLLVNIDRVIRTLEAFVAKSFKNEETDCPNDLLAFKLHYFKFIFEFLRDQKKLLIKKLGNDKQPDLVDSKLVEWCLKQLISEEEASYVNPHGGHIVKRVCRVFEEKFIRESIRQFPYKECALVKQMVTILAKQPIGGPTSAQFVITSCLNGQKFGANDQEETMLECATCTTKSSQVKMCTHCRKLAYCDQFCQRVHWPLHKTTQALLTQ